MVGKLWVPGKRKKRLVIPLRIDPTWQVVASSDDCRRQLFPPVFSLTDSGQIVGRSSNDYYARGGGMRFTNITIPQGATIDTAYLTLRCSATASLTVVNSKISAEDVDNPATFADDGDAFDTRFSNHTLAIVNWDNIPAWTKDVDYNSPEIKTVIKEIVDRGGWISGNAMVIFWEDFEDRSTHDDNRYRIAYSYNGSTTYAPKLVIEYTVPAVGRSYGFIFG